jgi:predicted RNase H-like nuclease
VAERELARAFGAYHAAAYNANTAFLERHKLMAGPRLGALLAEAGFSLDPFAAGQPGSPRAAFEMYPHAFHVTAFRLPRRLGYKKGALALRRQGFATYQQLLRALLEREAPQLLGEPAVERVLHPSALVGGGRALKATEDSLDALTCAIAALRAYRCGVAQADVFGDVETGYIAIPGLSEDDRFPRPAPAGP